MNIFKKFYCRAFQTVFKIAIPLLPYRKPEIISSLAGIPECLAKKNKVKPLIVTDKSIVNLKLIDKLTAELDAKKVTYAIYDETVPNPTTKTVEDAYEVYKKNACDSIIGFGGGSSMDCAKAVGVRVARPKTHLSKLAGILKVVKKLPLIIAIPTTAGTGSETTLASVIVDADTRHKYAINDFPLIPRYAVLDPNVTLTLPPFITATTGLDALTHAVEAYIGNSTTRDTREDAEKAVKLIFANLKEAYHNGSNVEARRNMLEAAYYAGCAFTKSYVGYVHAVAHSLGGKYNVPHGLANAIILPMVLEKYGEASHKKLKKLAVVAGLVGEDSNDAQAAKTFIKAIKDMKVEFEIGDTIPEIKEEDISQMSKYADKEANPLYPVPVLMDAEELKEFYYKLMV